MIRYKNKLINNLILIIFAVIGVFVCSPVFIVITGSVMGREDLYACLKPVYELGQGLTTWKIIPDFPTIEHYTKLMFQTPDFYVLFWNSVKMVVLIMLGQLIVGVPAAWAFSIYDGKISQVLFIIYIVLMLLPFQVTMLSYYIVLKQMSLLNKQLGVILLGVFNTFPVFITYGGFREIPRELLEAARIDGANELYIFARIGLPNGKGGILAFLVLSFLDYWNMIEQPLAFLEDMRLWPVSLYLPQISWTQAGTAFCASVFILLPAAFVFALGQDELEQGIVYSGLKG